MAFTTPSYDLIDLFSRVDRGDLQLPDFQRDYSWDIDRIRSLLISVLRGYPMGCFMALDVRNTEQRFRHRAVAGAPDTGQAPGLLLLDGQQRLTTLYHSLRGDGVVDTVDFRSKQIRRRFFVNVHTAVSRTIMPDEAVFATDIKGHVVSHYGPHVGEALTTRDAWITNGVVPLSELLSNDGTDMLFDIADRGDDAVKERVKQFHNQVLKPLVRYSVPMIRLDRETSRGGVGSIFAHANSAGLQMDIFDLLTAVLANEDEEFHLAAHWAETEKGLRTRPVLDGITRMDFLTAVTMLSTAEKRGRSSGASEDLLRLDLDTYVDAEKRMRDGFARAADFLERRCFFNADMVPYTSQIVPLAVILALVANEPDLLELPGPRDRLNRWFWSGIFGELYGSAAVKSRSGRDVTEVTEWIRHAGVSARGAAAAGVDASTQDPAVGTEDPAVVTEDTAAEEQATPGGVASGSAAGAGKNTTKGKHAKPAAQSVAAHKSVSAPARDASSCADSAITPASVAGASFNESRLLSIREDSAVYKGIYSLIMGRGAQEWRTAEPVTARSYAAQGIRFHQIFPSAFCFTHGVNSVLADSVLNRTPMSAKTDEMIGETDPFRYLPRVQGKSLLDDDEFDAVLASHLLDPTLLHSSDAEGFFKDRRRRLLTMVEEAMGRPAVHDVDDSDLAAGEEGPNAFRTGRASSK